MSLSIKNLRGGYVRGHDILQGLDLDVADGQAVGIIGLNGSGKSTLARAIMNMLPFRQGAILFDGEDVTRKTTHELSQAGIGFFLQGGRVFDELTGKENLRIAAQGEGDIKKARALLEWPERLLNNRADRLSGGQRHRLALAMCLLREPKLLILDEPSAGLDPKSTNQIYGMLRTLRQLEEITLLLIEQNIACAVDFCSLTNLLCNGSIERCWKEKKMNEIESVLFRPIS